jgi:AbrB family looped-hinge helix DNA binding protein
MARHETHKVMEGGAVVIPKQMREKLGIEEGGHVEFEQRDNGEILLRRGEAPPERNDRGNDRGGGDTGVAPNDVQKALGGIDYPADKGALVAQAKKNNAPREVRTIVERFPEREYGGPQEVMKAFGEVDNRP